MFYGEFNHAIDDKNRIVLPSNFREKLGEGAIMTIGFEGAMTIYPATEWEKALKKLMEMPSTSSVVRSHIRTFASRASECDLDKQGRVKIPSNLIEHAGIQKEVVIVGVLNIIEIWDKLRWDEYKRINDENFESVAEQLTFLNK